MDNDVIKGVDALILKLQNLKKTEAKKAIRKGTRAGAKLVQAKAKAIAPQRTGALRRGIKVRALKRSRIWTGTSVRLFVAGTSTYYGAFVDLGTKLRYTKRGKKLGNIKGRRFMKAASEIEKKPALDTAMKIIAEEINASR